MARPRRVIRCGRGKRGWSRQGNRLSGLENRPIEERNRRLISERYTSATVAAYKGRKLRPRSEHELTCRYRGAAHRRREIGADGLNERPLEVAGTTTRTSGAKEEREPMRDTTIEDPRELAPDTSTHRSPKPSPSH